MNTNINPQNPIYPIRKSSGVNISEKNLIKLCRHTFLDLWSFPNPHQIKGIHKPELCDLLVICDPHVIIFSDKSCEYKPTTNPIIAWKRWYKSAILDSIRQLYGAERIIKQFPQRIFLDRLCTQPLPLPIPSPDDIQIHRVVVAGGAASACRKERGGLGSLLLMANFTKNNISPTTTDTIPSPFTISHFGKPDRFVHVVDEISLNILLRELDTITDFIQYLEKKEKFIQSGRFAGANGEENMLAYYLGKINKKEEHDFVFENDQASVMLFDDTLWTDLQQDPRFQAKKMEDEFSYTWDSIIDNAAKYINQGTMRADRLLNYEDQQRSLRIMAREPRLRRRSLGKGCVSFLEKIDEDRTGSRTMLSKTQPDIGYVFSLISYNDDLGDEEYWNFRHNYLYSYCLIVASKYRHLKYVIGIATESGMNRKKRSHDFLFLETSSLSESDFERSRQLQSQLGFHLKKNLSFTEGYEHEYPQPQKKILTPHKSRKKIAQEHFYKAGRKPGRNWPCPCGSGKKYKKCCGR